MAGLTHEMIVESVPVHLRQYIVEQDYSRYTAQDHAVWRYIMRKNLSFLSKYAHPAYLIGLDKTGINAERIPNVIEMNQALGKIGWKAVVVNGFIPPAAFMEFQANNILVISAEMRTIGHILYTPAPDIVHEAAGHAPIIADEDYAAFLQRFGEYGAKAMSSKLDFEIYEAIRHLSIIKEYPHAKKEDVDAAEADLLKKIEANTDPSEATKLSRLHWWTVEYGLVGEPQNFKQYGAGLLSSVGESQHCLKDEVKKIRLDVDCVNVNYDITTMQPQLFVAEDWKHLMQVLDEFAATMRFRTGGVAALEDAIASENVATVVYSSGLQVSGVFSNIHNGGPGGVSYLSTRGETSLAVEDRELQGHGIDYHKDGFGSPAGKLRGINRPLEEMTEGELNAAGIVRDKAVELLFDSGVSVSGTLKSITRRDGKNVLMSFHDCTVKDSRNNFLFQPQWGIYDMAIGERITSVYSGSADKQKFNVLPPKSEQVAIEVHHDDHEKHLFHLYERIYEMRHSGQDNMPKIQEIYDDLKKNYPQEWLLRLECCEFLSKTQSPTDLKNRLTGELRDLQKHSEDMNSLIASGLEMIS